MVTEKLSSPSDEQHCEKDATLTSSADNGAPEQGHPGGATDSSAATRKKKKKKNKKKRASDNSNNAVPDIVVYDGIRELDTIKVTLDATCGRTVVASRDLEAGELVLHEPPFAKVVRRDCAALHCSNCCREVTEVGKIEAGVPFAVYCSRACKAEESALRSLEAGALGKVAGICAARDVDVDLLRMVLRLLVCRARALALCPPDSSSSSSSSSGCNNGGGQREEGESGSTPNGKEEKASFHREQWGNLLALMHHQETMDPRWSTVVREAAEDLMSVVPEWARVDAEEAVRLASRVNVNAHGVRDDSGSNVIIGVGLFPLTAMINHSCRPNCTFTYYGGELRIRTLEAVSAGTELSVYYIDLLQGTSARRKELLATKHFLCGCSRCESPEAADEYLDALCCVDCGASSHLSSTPPPSPEDALAAQLAQLGEIERPAAGRGHGKSGNTSGQGRKNKAKGGGANERTVGARDPRSVPSTAAASSSDPSSARDRGRRDDGLSISGQGVAGAGEGVMYCSTCPRQYPVKAVEESVTRAKASRDGAMTVLRAKNFPLARKTFEKWLQDHDAGSAAAPTAAKTKAGQKGRAKLKLHPNNSMVVQVLVPLSNCCSFEEDYSACARYLRRAVSAMEAVYPPHYPELGDFHAALADANTAFLEKRGQTLSKKLKTQVASERKESLERAAAIRTVCLGEEHPSTKKAVAALGRAC